MSRQHGNSGVGTQPGTRVTDGNTARVLCATKCHSYRTECASFVADLRKNTTNKTDDLLEDLDAEKLGGGL